MRAGFAQRKGFFAVTWSFGSLLAGIQAGGGAGAIQGRARLWEIGNSQGAFGPCRESEVEGGWMGNVKSSLVDFCC